MLLLDLLHEAVEKLLQSRMQCLHIGILVLGHHVSRVEQGVIAVLVFLTLLLHDELQLLRQLRLVVLLVLVFFCAVLGRRSLRLILLLLVVVVPTRTVLLLVLHRLDHLLLEQVRHAALVEASLSVHAADAGREHEWLHLLLLLLHLEGGVHLGLRLSLLRLHA